MSARIWGLFAVLGLVWGIPYLLIRVAVHDVDPLVVAFGRTLIGAVLIVPLAVRRGAIRPALRAWRWVLAFACVEVVGPWILLGHAETQLTSATTAILVATTPLAAFAIGVPLGLGRVRVGQGVGLVIGLAGMLALVGVDIDLTNLPAVGAVLLAAVGYATGPMIISRRLAHVPPIGVIGVSLLLAALIYLPGAAVQWPVAWTITAIWSITVLGVACTGIAFVLFFALVGTAGPARATIITYLNPVVAVVLGAALLHEPIGVGTWVGLPLVVVGSVLAARVPGKDRTPITMISPTPPPRVCRSM